MRAPAAARNRPAESTGAAGAVALLIARVAGTTDPDTIVALAVVVGFAPAATTWLVSTIKGKN